MGLRGQEFKKTYNPLNDRLASFYLPALSSSIRYDRSAGFCSSAALAVAATVGSINESDQAWLHNHKEFPVFCSWREQPDAYEARFDRLWHGKEKGWKALPIPDAVRQNLLCYCPAEEPRSDPLETAVPIPVPSQPEVPGRNTMLCAFLRDAPFMPGTAPLAEDTVPVTL